MLKLSRLTRFWTGGSDYDQPSPPAGAAPMPARALPAAFRDPITGLASCALLEDRIDQAVALAERAGKGRVGVLLLSVGPIQSGDTALLCEVARRLQSGLRRGDSLGPVTAGAGEFLVVLPVLPYGNDAALVAQKLLDSLKAPIRTSGDGSDIQLPAHIGISLFPADGNTSGVLIAAALKEMRRIELSGRSGYAFASTTEAVELGFRWPTGLKDAR